MSYTEEQFRCAGLTSEQFSWSDEELKLVTKTMKLTLAFLQAKGLKWTLATDALRKELYLLEGFIEARKR